MNIKNIEFLRKRFEKVFNYYGAKGLAPAISQLRIEQPLINGQGDYRFDLKKELLSRSEQNLKRNDLFVTLGFGIFLMIEDTTKPGTAPLLTYVPVGAGGFNTSDIEAVFNGNLYISTGTTVNIADMPTNLFKRIHTTQSSATTQAEYNMMDELHMLPEEITYAGTQDHEVRVTFPTFAAADYGTAVANGATKIVFVALGYKVPGGTAEQYKNDPDNPYRKAI